MTSELEAALEETERHLERLGRELLLRYLEPGIPADRVREELARVGLPSSGEVETLLGWHDGLADGPDQVLGLMYMFPSFYLYSIDDITATYEAVRDDDRWKKGWLPVFANGGGDFYVVDLSDTGHGEVRHFWIDELESPVEFDSITSMVQTINSAFDRGLFFVDDDGYFDKDYQAFGDLAREMNPGSYFWRG